MKAEKIISTRDMYKKNILSSDKTYDNNTISHYIPGYIERLHKNILCIPRKEEAKNITDYDVILIKQYCKSMNYTSNIDIKNSKATICTDDNNVGIIKKIGNSIYIRVVRNGERTLQKINKIENVIERSKIDAINYIRKITEYIELYQYLNIVLSHPAFQESNIDEDLERSSRKQQYYNLNGK